MRTDNGKLIVDLGDSISEVVSGSFAALDKSTINENATEYNLYPIELNNVPVIVENIYDASTPKILREELALTIPIEEKHMYLSQDGNVKVAVGSNFTLSIKAEQPQVLNVENGIPIIKQKTSDLAYVWSKDGNTIPNGTLLILDGGGKYAESDLATSYIKADQNNLIFVNVTPNAAGNFSCEIRNDIGSVQSEPISIVVNDPLSTFDAFFNKNLVQNPFGMNGSSGWTSIQGNIKTKEFLAIDTLAESTDELLKRPDQNIFGYTPNQFYPLPSNIRVHNIENYKLHEIVTKKAKLFSRENIKPVYDGVKNVAVYQDIDVSTITDYIQGKVYGVDAIRLFFGCYIGNALNRIFPTEELVPQSRRYLRDFYYYGAPRISVENFLWAGIMDNTERLKVVLQELDGDVILASRVIDDAGNIILSPGVELRDPISKKKDEAYAENSISEYPTDIYKIGYTLKPQDPENVVLRAYKKLYGTASSLNATVVGSALPNSTDLYYTRGQHVEYNTVYLDSLNKRTNTIRINLVFELDDDRFYEYFNPSPSEIMDVLSWDYPVPRGKFRSGPTKSKGNYGIVAANAGENKVDDPNLPDKPIYEVFRSGGDSVPVATGFGLSLHPVMNKTKPLIGDSPDAFKKSVIAIPTPEQDLADRPNIPAPVNPSLKFNPAGISFERYKIIFTYTHRNRPSASDKGDPAPNSFKLEIRVQKKVDGKYVDLPRWPSFSREAVCVVGVDTNGKYWYGNAPTYNERQFNDLAKKVGTNTENLVAALNGTFPYKTHYGDYWEYTGREAQYSYIEKMDAIDLKNICMTPAPQNWNFNIVYQGDDVYGRGEGNVSERFAAKTYDIKQGDLLPYVNYFGNDQLFGKNGYKNIENARGGERVEFDLENDNTKNDGFEDRIKLKQIFQRPAGDKNGQPPTLLVYDQGVAMQFKYEVGYTDNNNS